MARQYRIKEIPYPVNTFTPEYSDNQGATWNAVSQTTCLTESAAKQLIDKFIANGGKDVKEVYHSYNPSLKPLHD